MYRKTQGLPAFGKHSRAESARSTYLSSRKNKKTWLPKNTPFETTRKIWLPPRDSNPDMLIQSYAAVENDFLVIHFSIQSLATNQARTEAPWHRYRKVPFWRTLARYA